MEKLFVREFLIEDSDTIHNLEVKIDYIVGSGQHTNSHISESRNYLFQAPITFYVQKQQWDLAPGFENGNNSRFNRILNVECLSCHNSMPKMMGTSHLKFQEVGRGIDCETVSWSRRATLQLTYKRSIRRRNRQNNC